MVKLLMMTIILPDAMACDLMTVTVDILDMAVVRPLVTHIEGSGDGTAVGVAADGVEDALVQLPVEVIEAVVEGEYDQLRHVP